jgi:hypothetical protein
MPARVRRSSRDTGRTSTSGTAHKQLRAQYAALLKQRGSLPCCRCGQPIVHGEPWDLDHDDDRQGWRGPAHRRCNRRAGQLASAALRRGRPLPERQAAAVRMKQWQRAGEANATVTTPAKPRLMMAMPIRRTPSRWLPAVTTVGRAHPYRSVSTTRPSGSAKRRAVTEATFPQVRRATWDLGLIWDPNRLPQPSCFVCAQNLGLHEA